MVKLNNLTTNFFSSAYSCYTALLIVILVIVFNSPLRRYCAMLHGIKLLINNILINHVFRVYQIIWLKILFDRNQFIISSSWYNIVG